MQTHVRVVNNYALYALSMNTLTYEKLFYFGKIKKITKKVPKNGRKLRVQIVFVTRARSEIVFDYADTVLA